MGYTHHFAYLHGRIEARTAWRRLLADTATILHEVRREGVFVAGPAGTGIAELGWDEIAFNGRGEHAYGPFRLRRDLNSENTRTRGHAFSLGNCKTGRRPYDLAVTAVLLRARHLAPSSLSIGSDGTWEDWLPARELVAGLFGQDERDDTLIDVADGLTVIRAR